MIQSVLADLGVVTAGRGACSKWKSLVTSKHMLFCLPHSSKPIMHSLLLPFSGLPPTAHNCTAPYVPWPLPSTGVFWFDLFSVSKAATMALSDQFANS